ncbi:MAG: Lrp/AsnC family transcriptional regulator [Myxococcales bacterium]|nr:MAG: Lrp/AsnC family transcriptional regulator [Myxococcales bacterium]
MLDALDRQILQALQTDGRKSNADLARALGVAPSTMLERIRRLEERGVLKSYRAVLDPAALGLTIQAFVSVSLDRHDTAYIERFESGVQAIEEVVAAYHLTGRLDYMLHVSARDLPHLGEIIKSRIASIGGVGKVETFLVLSEIKPAGGWPLEAAANGPSPVLPSRGA